MEIITQTAPGQETEFEKDYIYNFILKDAKDIQRKQRIVVFSANQRRKKPLDVREGDIFVHLANENLRYNYCFFSDSHTVLRSYYNPFIRRKNCYAIPLGWASGFGNKENRTGEHSKYIWSFIGQIKGYRQPMAEAFDKYEPSYSRFSAGWNARALSDEEVKSIYLDSAFALIPFGTIHADTIRIMEVLEWGCIPVGVKYYGEDYYKYIYGDHPFVVGKDWEDAKRKVEQLSDDKEALSRKQKEVSEWYTKFKADLYEDITDILSGKEPSRGSQWAYQKKGHSNIKMLIRWYLHFYIAYDYLIIKRILLQKFSGKGSKNRT